MICTSCNKQIDDDSKFCVYCGILVFDDNDQISNLGVRSHCTKCGVKLDEDSIYCTNCGTKQIYFKGNADSDLEPFEENERWGFKDKNTREVIIPAKYSSVNKFHSNRAIVKFNLKYGVIDQNGIELTRFKYDFLDNFKNGFAKAKRDNKWTFLNLDCNELTSFIFNKIESFKNGIAKGIIDKNQSILINEKGNQITKSGYDEIFDFKENTAKVLLNNKFGLINIKGKELLPCLYDSIEDFQEGLAKVLLNNKLGLIDLSGKLILECEYNYIGDFKDGLALLFKSSKYGYVNSAGQVIVPVMYKIIHTLEDGSFAVKKDKKWKCVNRNGIDVSNTNSYFNNFIKDKRQRRIRYLYFGILILVAILGLLLYFEYNNHKLRIFKNYYSKSNYTYNVNKFIKINKINTYSFQRKLPLVSKTQSKDKISSIKQLKSFINSVEFTSFFRTDSFNINKEKRIIVRRTNDGQKGELFVIEKDEHVKIKEVVSPLHHVCGFNFGLLGEDYLLFNTFDGSVVSSNIYKFNLETNIAENLNIKGNTFYAIKSSNYFDHIFVVSGYEGIGYRFVLYDKNGILVKDFGFFDFDLF
jgi:RNA polymerase subunit RPABC4/transcription elongation factor Spt4